jgi:oligopeptide transport system substrate-binding protein
MRKVRATLCAVVALAVALGACGTPRDDAAEPTAPPATGTSVDRDAIISYKETEPSSPLVPGNTTEVGGIAVLGSLFRGLIDYDPKTGAPRNAVAESISSPDSTVWTIRLKPDWTFHDGSPVTAHSFVDAWHYTAYAPNRMGNASYLSPIQGFDQVNNAAPDGSRPDAPPPATRMSGLNVVDDRTFTVTLSAPFSEFGMRLGYAAFYPMPQSFFVDRAAFEARPIGNGPFRFDSYTPGRNIVVRRYDDYAGDHRPKVGGVEFRFYTDLKLAYSDLLANRLDYLSFNSAGRDDFRQDVPESQRVGYTYLGYQAIAFPLFDQRYTDPRLRQAISMAIDRPGMIQQVYQGARTPADGLVPPNVQGHVDNQCGELCTYQPQRAKELFDASGFTGPIELTSNVDTGDPEWMEVVCRSIQRTLGRECVFVPHGTFGEFRSDLNRQGVDALYRTAWVADYPSIENFLNPLFRSGAAANVGRYTNPAVDRLLQQADAAVSQQQGQALYQQAERLILQDMPTIPIWWHSATGAWSSRLENVQPTPFRELDLTSVTVRR